MLVPRIFQKQQFTILAVEQSLSQGISDLFRRDVGGQREGRKEKVWFSSA